MQRLRVYQSMWATIRRRPDDAEWSLETKLDMIHEAGFDGAGVRFFDREYVAQVTRTLRAWGLTWQAQCYPRTVDDLAPDRARWLRTLRSMAELMCMVRDLWERLEQKDADGSAADADTIGEHA